MTRIFIPGDNRPYLKERIGTSKKYTVRCLNQLVIVDDDKRLERQCSFKGRFDYVKNQIERGELHICTAVEKEKKTNHTITEYAVKKIEIGLTDFSSAGVYERMCVFVGKHDISILAATSDEMYDLLQYTFCLGASHTIGSTDIVARAKEQIPRYQRTKFTQIMQAVAQRADDVSLAQFVNLSVGYCSVAIDEGSVMKRKLLDFVLENPKMSLPSYPAFTYKMKGIKCVDYILSLANGLAFFEEHNIKVGTLICDGSTAQLKAMKVDYPQSLRNITNSKMIKKILVINCSNHKLHNCFKNCATKSDISWISTKVQDFCVYLKESFPEIAAQVPPHINTRWIYDFEQVAFLRKNKNKIMELTSDNFLESNEFNDYFNALAIFKALSLEFENPRNQLKKVIPKCIDAYHALRQFENKESPIAGIMAEWLHEYMLSSFESRSWALAYLTSPEGYSYMKKIMNEGDVVDYKKDDYIRKFFYRNEALHVGHIQNNDDGDSEIELSLSDEEIREQNKYTHTVLDGFSMAAYNADDDGDDADTDERNYTVSGSILDLAVNYLEEALQIIGTPSEEIPRLVEMFIGWFENPTPAPFRIIIAPNQSQAFSFGMTRIGNPEWAPICDVALRLEATPCSEASCERIISQQRRILNKHTSQMSDDTMKCRLQIKKSLAL